MNKLTVFVLSLTIAFISIFSINAQAAENIITAKDTETIFNIAKQFCTAELATDNTGSPVIYCSVDEMVYGVYFFGCNEQGKNCKDIQISSSWTGYNISTEQIDKWNNNNRFTKAYLDGDTAGIETDVVMAGGITEANLVKIFEQWQASFNKFQSEMLN